MIHFTKQDLREAILDKVETFSVNTEWLGDSGDLAFADSILDLMNLYADLRIKGHDKIER